MDNINDRRVLISTDAKTILDKYISEQRAKNAGVPGYMTSRNAVVSDILIKFITWATKKTENKPEPITLAADTQ